MRRLLTLLGCLLALTLTGCAHTSPPPLAGRHRVVQDKVVVLLHGYTSGADAMAPLFDAFARSGLPRAWAHEGAAGVDRYHSHSFDFGQFTRIGSDLNAPVEVLADELGHFLRQLPLGCPVCASWGQRPVEIVIVARSFGGIVARELLLQQGEAPPVVLRDVPGEGQEPSPWKVTRVISLGTPFFGSSKTRLTTGFLSIVINGLVRTVVMGFVRPEVGGSFGHVIDAQARALRMGSPYLWTAHQRWIAWTRRLAQEGEGPPPWLVVAGVGHPNPATRGDGTTRFASANLGAQLPRAPVETLITNVLHRELFREPETGRVGRELELTLKAMARFVAHGTLARGPAGEFTPLSRGPLTRSGAQIWLQAPSTSGVAEQDRLAKQRQLARIVATGAGDVWLRFYEGRPRGEGLGRPVVLPLRAPLSFFQNGIEPSRGWVDFVTHVESDEDGVPIPITESMATARPHLITIPDQRPAGPYQLLVRIARPSWPLGWVLTPEQATVRVEGQQESGPPAPPGPGLPLWVRPAQANLIHVYIDGQRLRETFPEIQEIEIREVGLTPIDRMNASY